MLMRWTGWWCVLAVFSVPMVADAADIYRWTDDQGKVHASDKPPAGVPKNKVTREDSRAHELSKRQRQEAQARAVANKSRLGQGVPVLPPDQVEGPTPLTAPQASDAKRTESECQRLVREYRESEACFAPYKIANGITRPEAFEHCKQVAEPSIKCGYVAP